jgi:putative DNA primase/helicase
MTNTDFRLHLLEAGYHPVPLFGKAPPMTGWQKRTNTNAAEIVMWGKQWPNARNTGILTRFTPTLDIEITHVDAAKAVADLAAERFDSRGYVLTRTGKPPKCAIPFRTDAPFQKLEIVLFGPDGARHKIEFLCDGQQVVVGGEHPDTRRPYCWHGGTLGEVKHDDLPAITAEEARQLVDDAVDLLIRDFGFTRANGKGATSGKVRERNSLGFETGKVVDGRERQMTDILCAKLIDYCGQFGTAPTPEELCAHAWDAYAEDTDLTRPGRGRDEFLQKCRSTVRRFLEGRIKGIATLEEAVAAYDLDRVAQKATYDKPRSQQRNDIITEDSAAVEFVEENADKLRYCHSTGAWFQWDGNIWRREDTQLAFHWARLLARRLVEDQDKKMRSAAGKTAFASGVEKFAQRDRAMAVTVDYWDRDQWLLGTPAGTVDLRTGKLRPGDPTDGITKSTLISPADTDCPLWLKFLDETTGGDSELIRFLQQWLGYCLTGSTREHALIFLYGGGGNGKGVFLNTTARIFGDYAATAAMDTFAASKNERHPTDLAKLRGARIVTSSETEEGHAWAEARIKSLTGGDKISARFMRQDFFEYYPQFKLTIIGNHKPVLRNVDDAMRRRVNIIPFLRKPPVVDRQLEDKLLLEAPGILQWIVEGCLDWQANGLIRPAVVQAATADYFSDQDVFGHWIEECCDVALETSLSVAAGRIVRVLDRLPTRTDELIACVRDNSANPVPKVRALLKQVVRDIRTEMAAAMTHVVASGSAAEAAGTVNFEIELEDENVCNDQPE